MTNKNKTTLYIGVTNDLCRRIYEHKNHLLKDSFTDKYNLEYCIYYEEFPYFDLAIKREKELKKWNRQKKDDLINKKNPEWKVLVTEKGFIRNTTLFSQQVDDFLKEFHEEKQIPPFSRNESAVNDEIPPVGANDVSLNCEIPPVGRNDERLHGFKGENGGGEAATILSPTSLDNAVISSEARNLKQIPPVGRNDERLHGFKEEVVAASPPQLPPYSTPKNDCHSERSEETKKQTL